MGVLLVAASLLLVADLGSAYAASSAVTLDPLPTVHPKTYSISYHYTTLPVVTLDPLPSTVYAGDLVVFSGTLTRNGIPLPDRTIQICEDDPFIPDVCLIHGTTNSRGEYHMVWMAEAGIVEFDFDIYAEYNNGAYNDFDQTPRYTMSIYKHGSSLTLDPIPKRAAFGETITLTGTLHLDAHSPEGSIVYIKDEDTLNPDDLLVSAYVDASGRFTTFWVVEDVDPDYTIDIQAVYEGGPLYYRQATPIQKLTAYYSTQEPAPEPGPVDDGYMKLYRSLDFEQPPRVAIVPSPDSYEQVRKHIAPVREGILKLVSILEQKYPSGNWNVVFEVVQPGGMFSERPDVKIDLVTRDDDSDCDWDRYGGGTLGWAYYTAPKPVPTVVCSLDSRTNEEIGATAVHEFVHAIGLGHTFNIPNDLMCSVEEDYGATCPGTFNKSTVFSELNLRALASIYGTDGFQNPNNHIIPDTRFATDGSITIPSADGTNGINTGAEQSGQYDYVYWPEDCIEYNDVAACLEYYCTSYWSIDGFLSYDTCLADPFYNSIENYSDVLWPQACYSYVNVSGCLEYYCASYWDIDGFSSYNSCLEDPFSYYNPYVDVLWPEDCNSYEYYGSCLNYYCASYWNIDGFSSYDTCLADPFTP